MSWPFTLADLTAGLRRYFGDTAARVLEYAEAPVDAWPSVGTIRGLAVHAQTRDGVRCLTLIVKEPQGATRVGLAGVGRREAGVYQSLRSLLPMDTPRLVAADPDGEWLIMEAVPCASPPSRWSEGDYREAAIQLARLHERFWNLADDLAYYPWLARPVTADFDIHVFAAAKAVEQIAAEDRLSTLTGSAGRRRVLGRLIAEAERVVRPLREAPQTLIHGDYWPGNALRRPDGRFILVDWQFAGIAPGVLDLVVLLKNSQWWFSPLPIPPETLVGIYARELDERVGHHWSEDEWAVLWDHAVMWHFLKEWIGVLAAMPPALVEARSELLMDVWLNPLETAVERRLNG